MRTAKHTTLVMCLAWRRVWGSNPQDQLPGRSLANCCLTIRRNPPDVARGHAAGRTGRACPPHRVSVAPPSRLGRPSLDGGSVSPARSRRTRPLTSSRPILRGFPGVVKVLYWGHMAVDTKEAYIEAADDQGEQVFGWLVDEYERHERGPVWYAAACLATIGLILYAIIAQ